MADLLKTGAVWLAQQQRHWTASRVTYTRGASSVEIPAMVGRVGSSIDENTGMMTAEVRHDFIIHVDDLRIDGILTEPVEADRIIDAAGLIYEVMGFPGQKHFEPIAHNQQYRIHAKHIDTQP